MMQVPMLGFIYMSLMLFYFIFKYGFSDSDPIEDEINSKSWIEDRDFSFNYEQSSVRPFTPIKKCNDRHELEYGKDFGNPEPTVKSGIAIALNDATKYQVPIFAKNYTKLLNASDMEFLNNVSKKYEKKKTKAKRRLRTSSRKSSKGTKVIKSKSSKTTKKSKQRVS